MTEISPDAWEVWTTITASIAFLAIAAVIALQIQKHWQEAKDQEVILRLRPVVVAAADLPGGTVLQEAHVRRALRRAPERQPSDRPLRRIEAAVGKNCVNDLEKGTQLTESMLRAPSPEVDEILARFPVVVERALAVGLTQGDRAVFAKKGELVPGQVGGAADGYEILGRREIPGDDGKVTLEVAVPLDELEAAAALADDGWHPMLTVPDPEQ